MTAGDEEPVLGSCKAGKPRVRRDLYEGREAQRLRWGTREAQDAGKACGRCTLLELRREGRREPRG